MKQGELAKRVRSSLAYTGQSREWLAGELGISSRTLANRLKSPECFTWGEVKKLKAIFRWESFPAD